MNTPTPTPRARRMWANYYTQCPVPDTFDSKSRAMRASCHSTMVKTIPVALIPLHNPEALISRASYVVDNMICTATIGDIVRAVLVSSGVLPRKGGRK